MDLALNIVDVLRQIYELRDAIRRQRHVNRRTYLRMMEIYVELQSSEGIQANATLQRTATLDKFSSAVTKFLLYLQKYNDMHKVVRMFKFATMEEQRLKIVDEIDQLYRMLNLATAVAVMNGAAAASSNATSLFAKLEDMHGDIRLTHDQIHAALLADKRRIVVPRKRFLGDHEPVLEKSTAGRVGVDRILIRQVPILKKYAPAAVYAVKEEFPPQDDPTVEYDMMEEKSPVVPAMQWGETKRSAVANEAEEKASVEMKAEMQPGTADVVVGTKVQAVQRVELEDLKHFTAYDDEEEKEPNNQQLTPLQEVTEGMEKEESKPSCDEPGLVRSTDDEMISEKQGENMEPGDQQFVLIQESADKAVDEKEEEVASGGRQSSHVDDSVEVTDDETVKTSNEQEEVMRDTGDDVTDADGPEANDTRVQQSDEEAVISPTAPQADPEEAEENDPTTQQLTQDTVDEAHEPSIEQSDVFVEVYDEVVESLPGGGQVGTSNEAVEEINAVSAEQLSLKVEEMIDEPTQQPDEVIEDIEEDETSSQHSELLSDTTDETDAETDDFQPEASISVSLDHFSVPLLVQRLGFDQVPAQQQEDTLLDLLRMCVTHTNRVQIYKTKGIPVLTNLVRNGETFLTQLYALHCLSWFTFSFSKIREDEFEELHSHVREPTHVEMFTLLHELQSGDDEVKERAALQCSCMATRGVADALRQVGVLPLLIDLLKNGTTNQKLWATEALLTLASDNDENCVAITRGGAIPLLVSLLRTGTDMHKQEAAYALGNLAANNEVNRAKIAREGAIPPMVEFVKSVTDAQNQWAVYALGFLSLNNEENRVLIAQEGAIRPLVELLRVGKRGQKQWAAYTLGNLAQNDANLEEITLEGAIAPLIQLLKSGTVMQKQRAAFALGNLACDNDMAADFDEAILPLVDLVRMGSDTQKEDAAYTLGNLAANNDARRAEIGRKGAITPLVNLLKTGDGDQKQWAAFALRWLAYDNESNRAAIVEVGAIASLTVLMEEGTDDQKKEAAHALEHLDVKNDATVDTFISDRIKTQLMGYFNADAISQNANVATTAALNTLGTVREGVLPLFRRFMKADAEAENESASQNGTRATPKAANKVHDMAGAW